MSDGVWRRARPARLAVAGAALALALGAAGCGGEEEFDLVAGKRAFVESCGACHVLNRAGTQGTQGPDLDAAFRQSLQVGMDRDGIRGAVEEQILYPANLPEGKDPFMPAKLVTGDLAEDVAAYVAFAVAREGEDEGLLAEAVKKAGGGEPAVAEDGVVTIPAAPDGQLAYVTERARAEPGDLVMRSPNESSVPHNIALELPGGDEIGEVVQDGGVSEITVDVEPGEYTFYCSVAGHREAGMKGTLQVAR